jgi:hypothetical protein
VFVVSIYHLSIFLPTIYLDPSIYLYVNVCCPPRTSEADRLPATCSAFLDFAWATSMGIVAAGTVFPLVFAIQAAYNARNGAIKCLGMLKVCLCPLPSSPLLWCLKTRKTSLHFLRR